MTGGDSGLSGRAIEQELWGKRGKLIPNNPHETGRWEASRRIEHKRNIAYEKASAA